MTYVRARDWVLVRLAATMLVACGSGQLGSEGAPGVPACDGLRPDMPVGLDEELPSGRTAREWFDAAVAAAPVTAELRWYAPEGSGSAVDTIVTQFVSGAPTTATLASAVDPNCASALTINGAVLRFQTADGTFDESMAGKVVWYEWLSFDGFPAELSGTYDLARAEQGFERPRVWLTTSLPSADGFMVIGDQSSEKSFQIATWSGPQYGTAGAAGHAAAASGGQAGASANGAADGEACGESGGGAGNGG